MEKRELVKGELIMVEVVDQVSDDYLIVALDGQLIRVKNELSYSVKTGVKMLLQIQTVNPIKLSIHNPSKSGLNRSA